MADFHSFLTTYCSSIVRTSSLEMSYFNESYYEPTKTQIRDWTCIMNMLVKYVSQHRKALHDYFMNEHVVMNFDDATDGFCSRSHIRRRFEMLHGIYPQKDMIHDILKDWIRMAPSVKRLQMVDLIGWFFITCFQRAKSYKIGAQQDRLMALGIYFFFYPKDEEVRAPWKKELIEILQINEILSPINLKGFPDLGVIQDAYFRRSNSFWLSIAQAQSSMSPGFTRDRELKQTYYLRREFWHVFTHSKVPRAAHVTWPRQLCLRDDSGSLTEFSGQRRFQLLSLDNDLNSRWSRVLNNHEVTAWCIVSMMHSFGNSPQNAFISLAGPLEQMHHAIHSLDIHSSHFRVDNRLWNMISTCRSRLGMLLDRMRDPRRIQFFGSINSPACAFDVKYGGVSMKAFFGEEMALLERVPIDSKGRKYGQSSGTTVPEVTLPDDEDRDHGSLIMLSDLCWKEALKNGE